MLHPHYPFVKISFHNNARQIISSTSQGSRFVVLALGHLSLHPSLKCKTNLSQSYSCNKPNQCLLRCLCVFCVIYYGPILSSFLLEGFSPMLRAIGRVFFISWVILIFFVVADNFIDTNDDDVYVIEHSDQDEKTTDNFWIRCHLCLELFLWSSLQASATMHGIVHYSFHHCLQNTTTLHCVYVC